MVRKDRVPPHQRHSLDNLSLDMPGLVTPFVGIGLSASTAFHAIQEMPLAS